MLSHVVIFWTKPTVENAARTLIEGIETYLRAIPQVVSLHVGRPVPSDRPVVDTSYQVGMVVTLADKAAETEYQEHKLHKEFLAKVFAPVCERVRVYDFAG